MPPLNPFLAAFFKSPIPGQCTPVHHFVLLVPSTDVLLTHRETDSGASNRDVIASEDFLASHVLRIPPSGAMGAGKDGGHTLRDMKGKAKPFNTFNSKSIIMKDSFIYTNKGIFLDVY